MATKEVAATAPLIVLLYDRTFLAGSFRAAWLRRRNYYLGLAATWLLLGALVWSTGGNRGGTVGLGVGVPWWAYGLTQFHAIFRYLALSVWPFPLVFEYGTLWVHRAAEVIPYLLIVLPLLAGTFVALGRRPVLGFCGAWFFLILAPSSLTPGTIQMIVEHRPYLPLAAIIALLVTGLDRVIGRRALGVIAMTGIALGILTARRNQDYRSPLQIWSDTVQKSPANPRAHYGIASALVQLGRFADALPHYETALRFEPANAEYLNDLGVAYLQLGRVADAEAACARAVTIDPDFVRAHASLAMALAAKGDPAAALQHYEIALRLAPGYAEAHYNMANVLATAGRYAEAAAHYRQALEREPGNAAAHNNLGLALLHLDDLAGAIREHEAAIAIDSDYGDAHYNLGRALLRAGRTRDAAAQFEAALRANPNDRDALLELQRARAQP
jgi:tetratricopeptide (TPR) repeat protein